jgi:hypothetical protein
MNAVKCENEGGGGLVNTWSSIMTTYFLETLAVPPMWFYIGNFD